LAVASAKPCPRPSWQWRDAKHGFCTGKLQMSLPAA
jgi:hypothetical protein